MCSGSLCLGSYVAVHALHWLMTSATILSIPGNQTFSRRSDFVLLTPWWPSCASCIVLSWRSAGMTILVPRSTRPSWVTLISRHTLLNDPRSSMLTSSWKLLVFFVRYHLFEKCSFFTAWRVGSSSVARRTSSSLKAAGTAWVATKFVYSSAMFSWIGLLFRLSGCLDR